MPKQCSLLWTGKLSPTCSVHSPGWKVIYKKIYFTYIFHNQFLHNQVSNLSFLLKNAKLSVYQVPIRYLFKYWYLPWFWLGIKIIIIMQTLTLKNIVAKDLCWTNMNIPCRNNICKKSNFKQTENCAQQNWIDYPAVVA